MKAVVLLSGGVDSATCLGMAVQKYGKENVTALSIIYGQKHIKEIECSKKLAEYYDVKRIEMDITPIFQFSNCPLLQRSDQEIEHSSYVEQIQKYGEGTVATYVPFRNGLMLSTAASIALSLYPNEKTFLYYGAHADDSAGRAYPDCSESFINAMNYALFSGSGDLLQLVAPLAFWNKSQVVKKGLEIGVPYHLTWSCYEGKEKACGKCGTCIDRLEAFRKNNVEDPIEYENNCN